jgi:hypothetical protein
VYCLYHQGDETSVYYNVFRNLQCSGFQRHAGVERQLVQKDPNPFFGTVVIAKHENTFIRLNAFTEHLPQE